MNLKRPEQAAAGVDERDPPLPALMSRAKPMGTFAGEEDFILRLRNGIDCA